VMLTPQVSVIVPTKNSSKYLDVVLKAVRSQTYENIELIVVDNNSTDNTKKIARKYTQNVYNKGPERSTQKNYGAHVANGTYVLFLDSDAELGPPIIEECVLLANQGADMVIIPEEHVGKGFWVKAKGLERKCFLNDNSVEAPWFFKKDIFLAKGGYNEEMYAGEDWDLFDRLRKADHTFARNQSFIRHHLRELDLPTIFKKKYYYGKNLSVFISKSNNDFIKRIPFFRKAYFTNWKLLISNPILTMGFLFLKLIESSAVAIGIMYFKVFKDEN
ncbi:glycosyltransferase family 2 protein, partial [Patescibacteria group bacterium]